jgi:hypothetical protein
MLLYLRTLSGLSIVAPAFVRWLSASSNQQYRACFMSLPPFLTNRHFESKGSYGGAHGGTFLKLRSRGRFEFAVAALVK